MKCSNSQTVARLLILAVLSFGISSCKDDPTSVDFGVELVQPLDIIWNGKDIGVPFRISNTATISARANIRVNWRLVITNQDGARYVQDDDVLQEQLLFAWKPPTSPRYPHDDNIFSAGDTCTAVATTEPSVRDEDAEKAVFLLVIEGNQSEEPEATESSD